MADTLARLRAWLDQPGRSDQKRLERVVARAGALADSMVELGDDELVERLARIDDPAAVAAAARVLGERHVGLRAHGNQLAATLALVEGKVVDLATGEGKTLVGALAAAVHAVRGRRVHVLTVNDYLAERDAEWMAPVFEAVGLRPDRVLSSDDPGRRRQGYAADVVYVALTELGFDHMRDSLALDARDVVVQDADVALVDEVDFLLLDQARVPLVLAGARGGADAPVLGHDVAAQLEPGVHFEHDSARTTVWLTDAGIDRVEQILGVADLYAAGGAEALSAINVALHARELLVRDVDYLVRDGRIEHVDAADGRAAPTRRWPDGLQAAVEVAEGLAATATGVILDQTTAPALMRRYETVVGMSGTAAPARATLERLYGAAVVEVRPNVTSVRVDEPLQVFRTIAERRAAVVTRTAAEHATGRPVLIGTRSVEESERIAELLAARDVRCEVLNARDDAREAQIVARAGARGAVTVATQMAGRGTDIVLGDAEDGGADVRALGGLLVLVDEPDESSRIDLQLCGRSGRQGDPGASCRFASLEDELVVGRMAVELAAAPGWPTAEDGLVLDRTAARLVERAQARAEDETREATISTWRYDAVTGKQRGEYLAARGALLDLEESFERTVRLACLDDAWADHLAFLAHVRESVHLQMLGSTNPWLFFNMQAEGAFGDVVSGAQERAARLLEERPDAATLDQLGIPRPSSTWTYVLDDRALGDPFERAVRGLRRMLGRDGRDPAEGDDARG